MRKALLISIFVVFAAGCAALRGTKAADDGDVVLKGTEQVPSGATSEESSVSQDDSFTKETSLYDMNPAEAKYQFALTLLKEVASSQEDAVENVSISPLSAASALSMLLEGSGTDTRQEILSALDGISYQQYIPEQKKDVIVTSANSLWLKQGFAIQDSFRNTIGQDFGAQIYNRDFSSRSTVDEINSWCSEHTNGKIPSIVDEIDPDMVLFILNALYFNAPWKSAFSEDATHKMPFYGLASTKDVDFMNLTKVFPYTENESCQAVMLPYRSDRYSFVVLLPKESTSLESFLGSLSGESFSSIMSSFEMSKVQLSLPKFKVEADYVLNETLQRMGIRKAFTPSADLSKMTRASVCVDQVRQKTFIEVSEKGTEAAAVTSIGVMLTALGPSEDIPVRMNVNRPFVYAIHDAETDDILFIGIINQL